MKYQTVAAGRELMSSVNRNTWAMADAVLADIPEMPHTGGINATPAALNNHLDALAEVLQAEGVVTPNGDPYSPGSLRVLRQTAIAWPAKDRHDQAAFRTHQEAGQDATQRAALAALCAVAAGRRVKCPEGLDADAFDQACTRIRERKTRRFPVAANDLRIAMERKPNIPERDPDHSTVLGVLSSFHGAIADMRRAGSAFNSSGFDLDPVERADLLTALDAMVEVVNTIRRIVEGVTDDDLAALLEVEQ